MSGDIKDNLNERGEAGRPDRFASEYHAPVLCHTVVKQLITTRNGVYVDGTLGGAGHSAALLEALSDDGRVVGIDQDDDAISEAKKRLESEIHSGRFIPVKGNFSALQMLLDELGFETIDGLLLDLGVSSHQLDSAERGFSHRFEAPLDMRMDSESATRADEILNHWDEADIVHVLRRLGEEPRARSIARKIVEHRPLKSTADLAEWVRASVPRTQEAKSLSRTFQAIRLAVNQELDALESVLRASVEVIKPEGRIAVISYHSLEDRRVKRFLRAGNFEGEVHRDLYGEKVSPWKEITRRPTFPSDEEVRVNPRARSARLRVAERIA